VWRIQVGGWCGECVLRERRWGGVDLLIRSFTDSFIHSLTHSFIHSLCHLLIHSLTHSFTHSLTHSFIHSFTHSFIHSLTHSLIHSSTHSPTATATTHGPAPPHSTSPDSSTLDFTPQPTALLHHSPDSLSHTHPLEFVYEKRNRLEQQQQQ